MYRMKGEIRFSETDEQGRLKLGSLINYMQDCVMLHSESLGVGLDYLIKNHRAWLLSSWQVVIEDCPKLYDEITVETRPYEFSNCYGHRNFIVSDKSGKTLVKANSIWVYVNTETGRPARPPEEEKAAYSLDERIEMDYAPRKLSLPDNMTPVAPIPVRADDIDLNHHVNNARYIEIALGLMPDISDIHELRVEYKRQAHLGDTIYPKIATVDNSCFVDLTDADGKTYTSVQVIS
ncbi:MAG: thioesterase [Oscillospiraceae bacterium]|nr:thioesterase [Oscillospiraceae bacterium]